MAEPYMTFEKKKTVLDENAVTILERLTIEPMFMGQLVAAGVMDGDQSTNIQAIELPIRKRQALIDHLRAEKVEVFLSFCIILVDQRKRTDIIKEFRLDIDCIKRQKRQFEAARMTEESNGQQAQPTANGQMEFTIQAEGEGQAQSNCQQAQPTASGRIEVAGQTERESQGQSNGQQAQPTASGGTSTYPIWDKRNPAGKTMLRSTQLYTNVTCVYDSFVQDVRLKNILPKFTRLKIINRQDEDRVDAGETSMDKVLRLMRILETAPVWRFHAFLKALVEDDQEACIELLKLDPDTYRDTY